MPGYMYELCCWRWQALTSGASVDPLVMVHAIALTFFSCCSRRVFHYMFVKSAKISAAIASLIQVFAPMVLPLWCLSVIPLCALLRFTTLRLTKVITSLDLLCKSQFHTRLRHVPVTHCHTSLHGVIPRRSSPALHEASSGWDYQFEPAHTKVPRIDNTPNSENLQCFSWC